MMAGSNAQTDRVIVVGAGIGGLSAALRLAHAGREVVVFDRLDGPGGKARTLPSDAGPIDAGPTVLTLRPVFQQLFADVGARLEDHVTLIRQPLVARHFWPDGSTLDLWDDPAENSRAIAAFAGARAARQFARFDARAKALFDGFFQPMLDAPAPKLPGLVLHVLRHPGLIRHMAPGQTLASLLQRSFDDSRLQQLFGRYATYVGGHPGGVPALLSLIWHAEAAGVWAVEGGLNGLAQALERLAEIKGATFHYGAHVARIDTENGRAAGITLDTGERIAASAVLFNGDPRALALGALGPEVAAAGGATRKAARSLSAEVMAFAATPSGPDLAHHNVFFRTDAEEEFDAITQGDRIDRPTVYVCAMDRGLGPPPRGLERFETIVNAAPLPHPEGPPPCPTRTIQTLAAFGLTFSPTPGQTALTTPKGFEALFPHSAGSLYGQSPHGTMAAFQRPTAVTPIKGLFLAGGGAHPGAGVPMAALSGRHAAAAILSARTSTSTSRPTAMPGGMSTASRPTPAVPSASSGS